jgi:hypothetical protein
MISDSWFSTSENNTLMAVCTRKLIRNIGIGGIIWGAINIAIGVMAIQTSAINVGILIIGVMMLGTGVQALRSPSLGVLLTETIVTVLLILWNIFITIINLLAGETFDLRGLIFPVIVAMVIGNQYRKLGHLRALIEAVDPKTIEATKNVCKTIVKKKVKEEPRILQTTDRKCRAQLMDDRAFFIQRDILRAFVAPKEAVRGSIAKPEAKTWAVVFNHPLGKLKYSFDKQNTEKLRNWLASAPPPPPQSV